MGSSLLIFFIENVLVFGLIFWLLTWLTEWFFQRKRHQAKAQFYECGFRAVSDLNLQINVNFSIVCAFLILYDVEFVFLFPALFNLGHAVGSAHLALGGFLFFILLSLVYDINQNALSVSI
jgi:NADH:ubiquinone oxidoreductase subunit 3 (subunit A)